MTLAQKFKDLRTDRRLSLADVSKRTGLERTTIWKIENGYLPRGSTLQKACFRGLGLKMNSPEWEEIQALWTAEGTGQPVTAQALAGQMAANYLRNNREMEQFFLAVSDLPQETWVELNKAIRRPAVLQGLAALNTLYEQTHAAGRADPARCRRGS
jgi:transcriptional regulator with XRE-family HTH domain